ncbi:MAG: SDR family NAD(P)-dependent oxidoreductase [Sphingomonadales bacterium]|nr:SDR family NAD(P)-dependent oxidoreductase [Sphingomonadales bacterium]
MSQPLEGRRVVVTGGAGGLGAPLAALLATRGAEVTIVDRVPSQLVVPHMLVDFGDAEALSTLCATLAADPPDILVNLAGIMSFGLHETSDAARVALCYHVNLVVPALLARAVAGPMRARGSGQIVNIGSMLGAVPYPWFAVYSSSKAGLAALSQALRRELAQSGVTVTHVAPRATRTAFNAGDVDRFLAATGMRADNPQHVARRIADAICRREGDVGIGTMERIFAAINALAPRLIDLGLARQVTLAKREFG